MLKGMRIIPNSVRFRPFIASALGLTLLSCYDPNAHSSKIVRELERNGSGDLSSMTTPEIGAWFANHDDPKLVARINAECAQLRGRTDAGWTYRTAEGRSCAAAASLAPPVIPQADHAQFGSVPMLGTK